MKKLKRIPSLKTLFLASTASIFVGISLIDPVFAHSYVNAHPLYLKWTRNYLFRSIDYFSVRRGWEVFSQVCANCHSIGSEKAAYSNLWEHTHTFKEASEIAGEVEVMTGPNDKGEMYPRPGRISDSFVDLYTNVEEACSRNNGLYPMPAVYMVYGKEDRENYIFSLLTGYCDPPKGVTIEEGQYYNPYMPDGIIGMPAPLSDDIVEYDDGTEATVTQLAYDVVNFLIFIGLPHDESFRKYTFYCQALLLMGGLASLYGYIKTRRSTTFAKTVQIIKRRRNFK